MQINFEMDLEEILETNWLRKKFWRVYNTACQGYVMNLRTVIVAFIDSSENIFRNLFEIHRSVQ